MKINLFKPILLVAILLMAVSAQATPLTVDQVFTYEVGGDEMDGIQISVAYVDGTTETYTWNGALSGATGSYSSLSFAEGYDLSVLTTPPLVDDTYWGTWSFSSQKAVTSFTIDAFTAGVVFDITPYTEGTLGSEWGWVDLLGYDVTLAFNNAVALVGKTAWGDIFGSTTFYLPDNLLSFNFQIDTDAVNPVPEPATLLLLGTGFLGIAGFRSRKKLSRD